MNYEALEGTKTRLVAAKGRGVITVSTTISNSRRKRFSIAHELGHFELHKEQRGLSLCVNQDIGGESGPEQPHNLKTRLTNLLQRF